MEHTYSFYVVDNLRYMQDGQRFIVESGLKLDAAIARYRGISDTQTKALGASIDEIKSLDLVHCRPAEPGEVSGRNLLVADYLKIPAWKNNSLIAVNTVNILKEQLCIGLMFSNSRIIPLPENEVADPYFHDKYLMTQRRGDYMSAVDQIYVVGHGWLGPHEFHEAFDDAGYKSPYFPYITAYNVNYYIPGRNQTGQADVTPNNFDKLVEKTKQYDLAKQKLGTERDCR
ncbi:MAG: hypothetical protein PHG30_09765 [Eubacteriales bacterium]|nr:hypothetical protein [Eubacteriales bacterium]